MSKCPKCNVDFHRERQNAGYCNKCEVLYVKKGWTAPVKTHPSQPSRNPVLSVKA